MESTPLEQIEKILELALVTQGAHHKQWYIEQALIQMRKINGRPFPEDLVELTNHPNYIPGIAP